MFYYLSCILKVILEVFNKPRLSSTWLSRQNNYTMLLQGGNYLLHTIWSSYQNIFINSKFLFNPSVNDRPILYQA